MAHSALQSKALDAKAKELIALGIAVAVRCDDCIALHVKAAVERGASKEEVSETLGMAIYMGAGPSVMYASHALEAFAQFEAGVAKRSATTAAAASCPSVPSTGPRAMSRAFASSAPSPSCPA
jgi:AhpD family alkylhydroperoxidase